MRCAPLNIEMDLPNRRRWLMFLLLVPAGCTDGFGSNEESPRPEAAADGVGSSEASASPEAAVEAQGIGSLGSCGYPIVSSTIRGEGFDAWEGASVWGTLTPSQAAPGSGDT